MNRFFAPKFEDDDLSLKEWVLYVYLLSMTYYKDSDNGKVRRGQAVFGTKDLEPMIPKTTATRLRDSLAKKGLIIVDKFTKFPNSKNLITLCKYDEINEKSGTQWDALVGRKWDTLQPDIIEQSAEFEKLRSVDKLLCGNAIELTELTSFTKVKDIVADTASTPPSKPKKTRKKSELPEWVTKLYLSKLAEHCNQTLDKVDSADTKKLTELFKVVSDESRMSQLFTYYFTLQDDFCKPKGYPLALLVKNQATFFRAMSVITPQQGKLRKATV